MSPLEVLIRAGRELYAATTPGPWRHEQLTTDQVIADTVVAPSGEIAFSASETVDFKREDAQLIAWAHQRMPELLDTLERQGRLVRETLEAANQLAIAGYAEAQLAASGASRYELPGIVAEAAAAARKRARDDLLALALGPRDLEHAGCGAAVSISEGEAALDLARCATHGIIPRAQVTIAKQAQAQASAEDI